MKEKDIRRNLGNVIWKIPKREIKLRDRELPEQIVIEIKDRDLDNQHISFQHQVQVHK